MNTFDKNQSGNIDFSEFIKALEGDTTDQVEENSQSFRDIVEHVFPQFLCESKSFSRDLELVDASGLLEVCRNVGSGFSEMSIEDCKDIISSVNACTESSHGQRDKISKEQFLQVMEFEL